MIEDILKELSTEVLNFAQSVVDLVEKHNLQNEQWFLDWLDNLNTISTSH